MAYLDVGDYRDPRQVFRPDGPPTAEQGRVADPSPAAHAVREVDAEPPSSGPGLAGAFPHQREPLRRSGFDEAQRERSVRMLALLAEIATCTDLAERARGQSRVINEYLPVAKSIASRYRGRGIERADLEQIACLGLVKAVTRWIPGRAEDFMHFAVPTITGEVRRYFRDHSWSVRPPRRIQELRRSLLDAEQEWVQRHRSDPTDVDLARMAGCSVDDVREAKSARNLCRPASLDAVSPSGSPVSPVPGEPDPALALVEDRSMLEAVMRSLSERERTVVELRFGRGWSQARIGGVIGVSQMQVSRLLREIAGKLRMRLEYC